ncbi:MAG: thioredoxin domain-containing protein [Nitrospina sp.]|nr:thioredoxin domain-containing protein [Nitrospina sp.]
MCFFSLRFLKVLVASIVVFLFGSLSSYVYSESKEPLPHTNNHILAIVDGKPLTLEDLNNAQIHDVMVRLHQLQSQVLREAVLMELAKKHPDLKLNSDVSLPTEDDVINFYDTTPGIKEMGTLEKMRSEIIEYLRKVFHNANVEERYKLAIKKGWVKIYLQPPLEFKLKAGISSAKLWFNEDDGLSRKVFLLEYSDFQCPFCKRVQGTLNKLREKYSKEVQFGYRHFPLDFHKEAKYMAESVECAREQGKFWELQKLLYASTDVVSRAKLHQYAKKAGVNDVKRFQTCLKDRKYKDRVLNDLKEGMKLGIRGTPTFILGNYNAETREVRGELFSGAVSEEKFSEAIEKYLSQSRAEASLVQ